MHKVPTGLDDEKEVKFEHDPNKDKPKDDGDDYEYGDETEKK